MFLLVAVSPHKVGHRQGPGLAWPVMAWLGINIGLDFLARAGVTGSWLIRSFIGWSFIWNFRWYWAKLVVPCWHAFLVEHRRWIIHLMEFPLEFLLDHMLVISFWYVV